MKRIIVFVLLKIAELLGVFFFIIQVPTCLGAGINYVFKLDAPNLAAMWILGIGGILACLVIVFFILFLFLLDAYDDYNPKNALIPKAARGIVNSVSCWISANWDFAGKVK